MFPYIPSHVHWEKMKRKIKQSGIQNEHCIGMTSAPEFHIYSCIFRKFIFVMFSCIWQSRKQSMINICGCGRQWRCQGSWAGETDGWGRYKLGRQSMSQKKKQETNLQEKVAESCTSLYLHLKGTDWVNFHIWYLRSKLYFFLWLL